MSIRTWAAASSVAIGLVAVPIANVALPAEAPTAHASCALNAPVAGWLPPTTECKAPLPRPIRVCSFAVIGALLVTYVTDGSMAGTAGGGLVSCAATTMPN